MSLRWLPATATATAAHHYDSNYDNDANDDNYENNSNYDNDYDHNDALTWVAVRCVKS